MMFLWLAALAGPKLDTKTFEALASPDVADARRAASRIRVQGTPGHVAMALEVTRFRSPDHRRAITRIVQKMAGDGEKRDFDEAWQWVWAQPYNPPPEYPAFKHDLYSRLDPRFAKYFLHTENAQIRLDEVRWGGVKQDGIPPLDHPEVVNATGATYLNDDDVVFGVVVNGVARLIPSEFSLGTNSRATPSAVKNSRLCTAPCVDR